MIDLNELARKKALFIDNAATASQNETLVADAVTREAIELNVIAPLIVEISERDQRIAALEAQLAEAKEENEQLGIAIEATEYSDGDASFWRHIAEKNLAALDAAPPAPKVTVKPLDNDYPISEVASWLTNQATRDYTDHEVDALKLAARILAALTAAQEEGR